MHTLLEVESVSAGRPNWMGLMTVLGREDNSVDIGGRHNADVVMVHVGVFIVEVEGKIGSGVETVVVPLVMECRYLGTGS